jgi:hypothetical protein
MLVAATALRARDVLARRVERQLQAREVPGGECQGFWSKGRSAHAPMLQRERTRTSGRSGVTGEGVPGAAAVGCHASRSPLAAMEITDPEHAFTGREAKLRI